MCQGRIVGVPGRAAAIQGCRVHLIQWRTSAQSLNNVGVRQGEAAQRRDVREPGFDVVGNLLTVAPIADDEDGCGPRVAEGPQQLVVTEVVYVQVRKVQCGEFADQVAVLCPDVGGIPFVDSAQRERR